MTFTKYDHSSGSGISPFVVLRCSGKQIKNPERLLDMTRKEKARSPLSCATAAARTRQQLCPVTLGANQRHKTM
jgi:hypothetical protein